VPLSVVKVKPIPREPKGRTSSTARLSAARASSVRQQKESTHRLKHSAQ
jgi:hypothetical protein